MVSLGDILQSCHCQMSREPTETETISKIKNHIKILSADSLLALCPHNRALNMSRRYMCVGNERKHVSKHNFRQTVTMAKYFAYSTQDVQSIMLLILGWELMHSILTGTLHHWKSTLSLFLNKSPQQQIGLMRAILAHSTDTHTKSIQEIAIATTLGCLNYPYWGQHFRNMRGVNTFAIWEPSLFGTRAINSQTWAILPCLSYCLQSRIGVLGWFRHPCNYCTQRSKALAH